MLEKMLKFTDLDKQTPKKEKLIREKEILKKFTMNFLMKKQKSNPVDVLNVEYLFVKYIVL